MGRKNSTCRSIASIAKGLRKREGWKYVKLAVYLLSQDIRHQFEFVVGKYSFDLVLLDSKLLIEFDGVYHAARKQSKSDSKKTAAAVRAGYRVERVKTASAVVIPITAVQKFI